MEMPGINLTMQEAGNDDVHLLGAGTRPLLQHLRESQVTLCPEGFELSNGNPAKVGDNEPRKIVRLGPFPLWVLKYRKGEPSIKSRKKVKSLDWELIVSIESQDL